MRTVARAISILARAGRAVVSPFLSGPWEQTAAVVGRAAIRRPKLLVVGCGAVLAIAIACLVLAAPEVESPLRSWR